MSETDIIYKVGRVTQKGIYSYSVSNPLFALRYHLDQWTEAKIGGVLCFPTLSRACWFISGPDPEPHVILRCIGNQPMKLPEHCISPWYLDEFQKNDKHYVKALWKEQYVAARPFTSLWPKGTVAYRRVMPLEVVNMG